MSWKYPLYCYWWCKFTSWMKYFHFSIKILWEVIPKSLHKSLLKKYLSHATSAHVFAKTTVIKIKWKHHSINSLKQSVGFFFKKKNPIFQKWMKTKQRVLCRYQIKFYLEYDSLFYSSKVILFSSPLKICNSIRVQTHLFENWEGTNNEGLKWNDPTYCDKDCCI